MVSFPIDNGCRGGKENHGKRKKYGRQDPMGTNAKEAFPYTLQKGFRYLKHYGPKEFWIRLHERFEPEEIPYGPWYEAYVPDEQTLEKQRKQKFSQSPLISIAVPAYKTPGVFLRQMLDSVRAQTYGNWELCIATPVPAKKRWGRSLESTQKRIPGYAGWI